MSGKHISESKIRFYHDANNSLLSSGFYEGILEILDLSGNKLTGRVPDELSSLEGALVNLGNNPDL